MQTKKIVEDVKETTNKGEKKGRAYKMNTPLVTGLVIGATLGGLTAAALTNKSATKNLANKAKKSVFKVGDSFKKVSPMTQDSTAGLTRGQKAARTAEMRYGKDYFQTIGAKGGMSAQRKKTAHKLTQAERSKGGEVSSAQQDMHEIGRKGGEA